MKIMIENCCPISTSEKNGLNTLKIIIYLSFSQIAKPIWFKYFCLEYCFLLSSPHCSPNNLNLRIPKDYSSNKHEGYI